MTLTRYAPRETLRARVLVVCLLVAMLAAAGPAAGQLVYRNPLRLAGSSQPLSCPDPSVIKNGRGRYRYFAVCTSDFSPNAFPVLASSDLVHWLRIGSLFPKGHEPWWARASTGATAGGRYWAPEIYRINRRWVVYFAAQYDPSKVALRLPGGAHVSADTMVIGVATSSTLHGPWTTRILHYRGQFNATTSEKEDYGGVIDPSVVRDPRTDQLYLFWAAQQTQIWVGRLSQNGLTLDRQIHNVLVADESWEWDPVTHLSTIEAPEPFYKDGQFYLLYSGASTWNASYAVAVAVSPDPIAHPFVELGHPILQSGGRFLGPGHTSHPIVGPDGRTYILYHAETKPSPSHISADRDLMLGRLNWVNGYPLINNGHAM